MAKLISDYISKGSFTRFGYKLYIRNETSHTIFTKTELINICELKDNGITVELPINVCQKGHNLTLFFLESETIPKNKLKATGSLKEAFMEIIAKVEKIENSNKEKMVFADLIFSQLDVKLWQKIINSYAENQEKIDNVFMEQHKLREKK